MPIVFEGRVFSVDVETVRLPDGREHRLEIVRHRPSVVLLPMPDDRPCDPGSPVPAERAPRVVGTAGGEHE